MLKEKYLNDFLEVDLFSLIYVIKQDIHIYVAYSRLNGWTEWAESFLTEQKYINLSFNMGRYIYAYSFLAEQKIQE